MNAYIFNLRTRDIEQPLKRTHPNAHDLLRGLDPGQPTLWSKEATSHNRDSVCGHLVHRDIYCSERLARIGDFDLTVPGPDIYIHDSAYAGAITIYLLYAALYGGFQGVVLYTLSTFTNDPRKTAALGGLYVGGKWLPISSSMWTIELIVFSSSSQYGYIGMFRSQCHANSLPEHQRCSVRSHYALLAHSSLYRLQAHYRHQLWQGRERYRSDPCSKGIGTRRD